MLKILHQVEKELPNLLKLDDWQSMFVDYHKPFVERVWRQWNEYRIYLHLIHPCLPEEALFHGHPWPSVVKNWEGKFEHGIGFMKDGKTPVQMMRQIVNSHILSRPEYDMIERLGCHYVAPIINPLFSLMVTGKPWKMTDNAEKMKYSSELSFEKKLFILNKFREWYSK